MVPANPPLPAVSSFLFHCRGHPEFEVDFRRDGAGHAAKCGNIDGRAGRGRSELARCHGLRESNRDAGQAEGGQAFAGLLCELREARAQQRESIYSRKP